MKPTLEEYQTGCTSWRGLHNGISYELIHHGISEYKPEGIWCYYIFIAPKTFQNPEHFKIFDLEEEIIFNKDIGKYWNLYNYHSLDELIDMHCGITWYSKESRFCRETGEFIYGLKIGCDYSHLYDRDINFIEDKSLVEMDAKNTIDKLVKQFPVNSVCKYSGKIDKPENFYTSKNGQVVHNSLIGTFSEGWHNWEML